MMKVTEEVVRDNNALDPMLSSIASVEDGSGGLFCVTSTALMLYALPAAACVVLASSMSCHLVLSLATGLPFGQCCRSAVARTLDLGEAVVFLLTVSQFPP